ncbi:MAG: ArsR family transcriptional regulator [Candidatus Aenigmarchaeota archaeon]|nr:ArsR family transcriptional regulator [Candidatus Aenigmarchaeota archaeon]
MVRTLKDAIILSKLKEEPKTSEQIAQSMRLEKKNITKSLSTMKRSGLVRGRGLYMITNKGRMHFDNTLRKIDGHQ